MKKLPNKFPWYPKLWWAWPDTDQHLQRVNDWVADIEEIIRHVKKFDVCVQAGGACGIWPVRFASYFDRVFTFEPEPENFECLASNCEGYSEITVTQAALGRTMGTCNLALHHQELGNAGAHYTVPGNNIRVLPIDALQLSACDLIQLDVEGAEFEALKGAEGTIKVFKPTIVIEEKQLPQCISGDHLKARHYLETFGYREVATIHKDVVFAYAG